MELLADLDEFGGPHRQWQQLAPAGVGEDCDGAYRAVEGFGGPDGVQDRVDAVGDRQIEAGDPVPGVLGEVAAPDSELVGIVWFDRDDDRCLGVCLEVEEAVGLFLSWRGSEDRHVSQRERAPNREPGSLSPSRGVTARRTT